MYSAGYRSVANVDYSSVCIATMSARHSDCPGMTWHQMDISRLSFPDASFDVVLEKATLDAILVEEKSPWELSAQAASFLHTSLTEVRHPQKPWCHEDRVDLMQRSRKFCLIFLKRPFKNIEGNLKVDCVCLVYFYI